MAEHGVKPMDGDDGVVEVMVVDTDSVGEVKHVSLEDWRELVATQSLCVRLPQPVGGPNPFFMSSAPRTVMLDLKYKLFSADALGPGDSTVRMKPIESVASDES